MNGTRLNEMAAEMTAAEFDALLGQIEDARLAETLTPLRAAQVTV